MCGGFKCFPVLIDEKITPGSYKHSRNSLTNFPHLPTQSNTIKFNSFYVKVSNSDHTKKRRKKKKTVKRKINPFLLSSFFFSCLTRPILLIQKTFYSPNIMRKKNMGKANGKMVYFFRWKFVQMFCEGLGWGMDCW
jgi:hypothetical protein